MFLLPALGAFCADSLVIYLHAKYSSLLECQGKLNLRDYNPLRAERSLGLSRKGTFGKSANCQCD